MTLLLLARALPLALYFFTWLQTLIQTDPRPISGRAFFRRSSPFESSCRRCLLECSITQIPKSTEERDQRRKYRFIVQMSSVCSLTLWTRAALYAKAA